VPADCQQTTTSVRYDAVGDASFHGSTPRAWKMHPATWFSRDATLMEQLGASADRPLLSVENRQGQMQWARRGDVWQGRTCLEPGGDGQHLNRRVKYVLGDHPDSLGADTQNPVPLLGPQLSHRNQSVPRRQGSLW
jgi:hypothetical protein